MRLEVDGRDYAPAAARFIFQAEPFPGGHRYRLWIDVADADQDALDYAKFQSAVSPATSQSRTWLFWLGHIVSRVCDPETALNEAIVLNNIDVIEVDEREIRLSGICSPWMHTRTIRST